MKKNNYLAAALLGGMVLAIYYHLWYLPNLACSGSGWENLMISFHSSPQYRQPDLLGLSGERLIVQATTSNEQRYELEDYTESLIIKLGFRQRKETVSYGNLEVLLQIFAAYDQLTPWINHIVYLKYPEAVQRIDRRNLQIALCYPCVIVYERERIWRGKVIIDVVFIGKKSLQMQSI